MSEQRRSSGHRRFWMTRSEHVLFTRPLIFFSAAFAVCLVVLICELAALGSLRHWRLLLNILGVALLVAGADLASRSFRCGWIRLTKEGYRFHQPWSGQRESAAWREIDMAAIVPGEMVTFPSGVALLLVTADGQRCVLEYRPELLKALLRVNPGLRIAALPETKEIRQLLHQLDQSGIGWLPLSWQERDGNVELVLRHRVAQEA